MTSNHSQITTPTATIAKSDQTLQPGSQPMSGSAVPMATTDWQPAVEIRETEHCIYVQLQLPGFEREEVEVQAFETAIVVRGAHFPSHAPSQGDVLTSEFCYGTFERVLTLPGAIAVEQVQAELSCGLLTLSLVKTTAV